MLEYNNVCATTMGEVLYVCCGVYLMCVVDWLSKSIVEVFIKG